MEIKVDFSYFNQAVAQTNSESQTLPSAAAEMKWRVTLSLIKNVSDEEVPEMSTHAPTGCSKSLEMSHSYGS